MHCSCLGADSARRLGVAVPWREEEVRQLLDGLLRAASSPGRPWFEGLWSLQLATLCAYLWEAGQRGGEAGRLHRDDHTNRCGLAAAVQSAVSAAYG